MFLQSSDSIVKIQVDFCTCTRPLVDCWFHSTSTLPSHSISVWKALFNGFWTVWLKMKTTMPKRSNRHVWYSTHFFVSNSIYFCLLHRLILWIGFCSAFHHTYILAWTIIRYRKWGKSSTVFLKIHPRFSSNGIKVKPKWLPPWNSLVLLRMPKRKLMTTATVCGVAFRVGCELEIFHQISCSIVFDDTLLGQSPGGLQQVHAIHFFHPSTGPHFVINLWSFLILLFFLFYSRVQLFPDCWIKWKDLLTFTSTVARIKDHQTSSVVWSQVGYQIAWIASVDIPETLRKSDRCGDQLGRSAQSDGQCWSQPDCHPGRFNCINEEHALLQLYGRTGSYPWPMSVDQFDCFTRGQGRFCRCCRSLFQL